MQPVKLGGLTLKSEEKKEDVEEIMGVASEGLEVPEPEDFPVDRPPSIGEELYSLIQRVEEEVPKSDNLIKALGKLKGALQLLS